MTQGMDKLVLFTAKSPKSCLFFRFRLLTGTFGFKVSMVVRIGELGMLFILVLEPSKIL